MRRLLIANRGEIAIRIARAASELGIETVAIVSADDAASLHARRADSALSLTGDGPSAYLDADGIVAAALRAGADSIHPGYGFLSESADFARRCSEAGLTFVGPRPETLALFGDKAAARSLAERAGLPLARGTSGATDLAAARAFMAELSDRPVMVKALAGGGGRGMRVVDDPSRLAEAFERAASEAQAAFGSGELYVEELVSPARHVEIQLVGDRTGAVVHLFDRECSLQRRRQKVMEIAPAPGLDPSLRQAMTEAAVKLAQAARLTSLCTVEFLLEPGSGRCVFMEANPRLQVEHPVTEEVMGIDLVRTQLRLASGETLAGLALTQAEIGEPRGLAIEMRINMERLGDDGSAIPTGGTLTAFEPPGGAGIRIETFGYAGYATSTRYDSLLAKVIAHVPSGLLADALGRGGRALQEFRIEGVETNRGFLQNLLIDPDVVANRFDTLFVERNAGRLAMAAEARDLGPAVEAPAATGGAAERRLAPSGTIAIGAPLGGRVVSLRVEVGDTVVAGRVIGVIEAMKMEHAVAAPRSGVVHEVCAVVGDGIAAGDPLAFLRPADAELMGTDEPGSDEPRPDDTRDEHALDELRRRKAELLDEGRSEAVARQRKRGALTARERIARLCDPASFREIGGLIRSERADRAAPADGIVVGSALIEGRPVMVMSQDFTVFGGSSGRLGGSKMERATRQAMDHGIPVVMLLDGGGHRIQDGQSSRDYAPAMSIFHDLARMTGWVPVVSAILGAGFAANTNYSSMADLVVMVRGLSAMGLAGPALVRAGTGEEVDVETLGGAGAQVDRNGLADLGVESEEAALTAIRTFLSYLPSNARDGARLAATWSEPREEGFEGLVPANTRRAYDMHAVIGHIVDPGSLFEIKPTFARNVVTSLARLAGRPVGIIANQPLVGGGMLDAPACEKAARFVAFCDAFGLPVISLVDIPGLLIGSAAERSMLGRRSAKLLFEFGHATVPRISVILRKGYGLGYLAMAGGRSFDADACFVWPTAEICAMSVEGSVDVAFRRDYERAPDPAERRRQLIAEIRDAISPIKAAEGFGVDDVIWPSETRARLLEVLARAPARRRNDMPPKFRAIPPI